MAEQPSSYPASGSQSRILVVDDDPMLRNLIKLRRNIPPKQFELGKKVEDNIVQDMQMVMGKKVSLFLS